MLSTGTSKPSPKHPRTLFDKIWDRHEIIRNSAGQSLLFIDQHFCHELSFHAFNMLKRRNIKVRHPSRTAAIADHYTPTTGERPENFSSLDRFKLYKTLESNATDHGVEFFGLGDDRRGIIHVVGPEQGLSLPGSTIVCGDSHTATHGGVGALSFGIGASDVSHVLATQTLWQPRPKKMRIKVIGRRPPHVSAKDTILAIISKIGTSGATGHVIEYAGPVISNMSVEERLTVCNMSIEAGARAGMVAPDYTVFEWIAGRPYAPSGQKFSEAIENWQALVTDEDASFDLDVEIDGTNIAPMVSWGTSPEDTLPITGSIPDPQKEPDREKRRALAGKLEYMGLKPGSALMDTPIDCVFIGSCTNSRIQDLREAAAVARGRTAKVRTIVVPGSALIKSQAEKEGLDKIFRMAGFDWRPSAGCSMCVGVNGDLVAPEERCVSTSNRNFRGRQGPRARTHLVGPAMAAAAAVTGRLTDVRKLERL
ncbi:MAG: 3-isopropylmalate dehydratase large subunit [Rhodospirillaceae bacterium]